MPKSVVTHASDFNHPPMQPSVKTGAGTSLRMFLGAGQFQVNVKLVMIRMLGVGTVTVRLSDSLYHTLSLPLSHVL